jgi:hypothetical protein
MVPNTTPQSTAGTRLPPTRSLSQVVRQRDEDDEERDVKAGELRRVPEREGGEGRPGRDDQPDLVAVPDAADRVDQRTAFRVGAAEHRQ